MTLDRTSVNSVDYWVKEMETLVAKARDYGFYYLVGVSGSLLYDIEDTDMSVNHDGQMQSLDVKFQ